MQRGNNIFSLFRWGRNVSGYTPQGVYSVEGDGSVCNEGEQQKQQPGEEKEYENCREREAVMRTVLGESDVSSFNLLCQRGKISWEIFVAIHIPALCGKVRRSTQEEVGWVSPLPETLTR